MGGDDRQQAAMFRYLSPAARVPPDHPLRVIRTMVDQVLAELSPPPPPGAQRRPASTADRKTPGLLLSMSDLVSSRRLLADVAFSRRLDVALDVLGEQQALLAQLVRGMRHRALSSRGPGTVPRSIVADRRPRGARPGSGRRGSSSCQACPLRGQVLRPGAWLDATVGPNRSRSDAVSLRVRVVLGVERLLAGGVTLAPRLEEAAHAVPEVAPAGRVVISGFDRAVEL